MQPAQRIDFLGVVEERLLADQRLHQRIHVIELLDRPPARVTRFPVRFRRQPHRERLGEVFIGMTLRVPRIEVHHEALAVGPRIVELRVRLLRAAEQPAALLAQPQLECVVDHVAGLVAQDAHAPFVLAAFHRQHLRFLEPFQARVRQIKGHRHRGLAIRREPLIRQVEVQREVEAAIRQLFTQLRNAGFHHRPLEFQGEVRHPQVEELLVGQIRPVGRNRSRHQVCVRRP